MAGVGGASAANARPAATTRAAAPGAAGGVSAADTPDAAVPPRANRDLAAESLAAKQDAARFAAESMSAKQDAAQISPVSRPPGAEAARGEAHRGSEVFGPALVLRAYGQLADAVQHINRGPRPLACALGRRGRKAGLGARAQGYSWQCARSAAHVLAGLPVWVPLWLWLCVCLSLSSRFQSKSILCRFSCY